MLLGNEVITLVYGPAGSGKTALLSRWHDELQAQGRSPVWVTLDANERTRDALLARIDAAVAAMPAGDRVVLVDETSHRSHDVAERFVLDTLTEHPGVRLVLAGRRKLRLPLRPDLVFDARSIGPEQLRLSDEDAAATLGARVPDLDPELAAWLVRRVDGWAAGVHIAANALANAADPIRFTEEFDGTDRDIADYFEAEILSGLPTTHQQFLLGAAVLTEPTAELCDEILGMTGSDSMLAELCESSAFLCCDPGPRYRWMPLAREFLLSRARRSQPELARRREIARLWYERNGQDAELIEAAVEAQEWSAVADALIRAGLDFVSAGRTEDVKRWMRSLPSEVFNQDAGLSIVGAIANALSEDSDPASVDDWLALAGVARVGTLPGGAGSIDTAILVTRSAFCGLGPREGLALAHDALALEGQSGTAWAALAHAVAGSHAYLDAQADAARSALSECLLILSDLDPGDRRWVTPLLAASATGFLAMAQMDSGDYQSAAALISSLRAASVESAAFATTDAAALALGRWAQHRGDETAALEHYVHVARRSQFPRLQILAHLEAAATCAFAGSLDTRDEHVAAADRLLARVDDPGRLLTSRRMAVDAQRSQADVEALTDREREVLRLLDSNRSRREIAAELYLSHNTVKTYVRRLYHKLDVSSRPAAVARARERGWL